MAEGDARDYVLAFENDKPRAAEIARATADKLQKNETKLLDVVKALGEYITEEDEKIRTRAVNYLTAIILALPPTYLTRQQIQVLNTFLCSRIDDGGAIEGLSRLQSLSRYTNDMASDLSKTIYDRFAELQSRPQSGRFKVYSLLNELLSNHRKAIKDLGDTSLLGTVHTCAGEKDPRNLMLIFSMLRVFMIEWDISKHIDILFDAVYAYFPITFRPPPNDPYGITAQDLKDRLRDCLSSTGLLAQQVFPNMLDRLDSTSETVKKDVLQVLAACALNYGPTTISQFSITLWDAVKFEVLQAQEPILAEEALKVLTNIAICLSQRDSTHAPTSDPLVKYLNPIIKECLEHMREPAARQAGASGDILKAVSSGTIQSFEIVVKGVGPPLFTLQQASEGILNQRAILTVVNQLFEASIEVYGSELEQSSKNSNGQDTIIVEFKERLLAIYSRALMSTVKEEVSYRLVAAKGLLLLSQMRHLLDENETGLIVQHFNEIVLDEESYSRDELKQKSMAALADISRFRPRLITDITFPKFIARLPEDEDQASQQKDYQPVLEGLAEISIGKDLLETLVRRLLNKLDILIQGQTRPHYPYTCSIISTIFYVLSRSVTSDKVSLDPYFDRIVVGLSQKSADATAGPLSDESVLQLLGRTVNLVVRNSKQEYRDYAAANVYNLFQSESRIPYKIRSEPEHALVMATWLLASISQGSKTGIIAYPSSALIHQLVEFSKTSKVLFVQVACLKQLSLIVNKHVKTPEDLTNVEDLVKTTLCNIASSNNVSEELYEHEIRLLFAISKALVFRLAPQTNELLIKMVSLLDDVPIERARYIALSFSTLLAEDEILCKQNDAQIRLLTPQRVFRSFVPMISTRFRNQDISQERKEVYLIALSGMLSTVPSEIVMPELSTLLPLLLSSLQLPDSNANVKSATLETMATVIAQNPVALLESGHVPALTRRLLTVATLPKLPTSMTRKVVPDKLSKISDVAMKDAPALNFVLTRTSDPNTRRLAIRCLSLLPTHITDKVKSPNPLLSLKKEVLQGIANMLDDPRRDVRKEAVDARARWLRNLDEEDSDAEA